MEINLKDPDYVNSILPRDMAYCFNHSCPKANKCFRHIAALVKKERLKCGYAIYPDALQEGRCDYFLRPRAIAAAWGFAHLYDNVKHSEIGTMRAHVMGILGGRTSYYRYHRGEKRLTPEQQDAIKDCFASQGYEKPTFDYFKEMIDFISTP